MMKGSWILARRSRDSAVGHLIRPSSVACLRCPWRWESPPKSSGNLVRRGHPAAASRRPARGDVPAFGDMPNDLPLLTW